MQPKTLLRVAAVAIALFDLGHTLGGMILAPSHGPEEDAVLASLAAYKFDVMGTMRSHADFYDGGGWYLTAILTALVVMVWQLSNAVGASPALVRRLTVVLALFFVASVGLCAKFFFAAPLALSAVAAVALGAAALRLRAP